MSEFPPYLTMSLSPSSPDWMVLQCRACGTRMKSRRDVDPESRLLCPKCRTPVPVQEEGQPEVRQGVEFRPGPLPDRPALSESPASGTGREGGGFVPAPRPGEIFEGGMISPDAPVQPRDPAALADLGEHPEFDGVTPAEEFEYEESPQGERRRRIKKRRSKRAARKYVELTDWNQSELAGIPEAEVAADIWMDVKPLPEDVFRSDENEYVVKSEEDEDGQTRLTKKKVRRRRLLAGARLFFTRFTKFSRYFTVALGLLLAGVAFYGFSVYQKKYVVPPAPPIPDLPVDRRVLTQYDLQGAEQAVRDFLAADGVEAKIPFVRQAGRVRPLMEKWYQNPEHPAGPLQAGNVALQDKVGGEGEGMNGFFIILAMTVYVPDPLNPSSTVEEMTYFSVEEIRKGPTSRYLVDWETSTGYQEIPLETFKATMPPESYAFRVYVKSADYYNHGFEELEWQCVELYYPGRDFKLWGYVSRRTLEGRALLMRLENGWSGGIIAELQYPENPVSRDQVIVRRMIHDSWYYKNTEETAE